MLQSRPINSRENKNIDTKGCPKQSSKTNIFIRHNLQGIHGDPASPPNQLLLPLGLYNICFRDDLSYEVYQPLDDLRRVPRAQEDLHQRLFIPLGFLLLASLLAIFLPLFRFLRLLDDCDDENLKEGLRLGLKVGEN